MTPSDEASLELIARLAEEDPFTAAPPAEATSWSSERIRAYFEAGGVDKLEALSQKLNGVRLSGLEREKAREYELSSA